MGGGPPVPLREVETRNKIHPDHPHSPTPSLATVPKVNKNALFPTIFTSRDQLVRPRRPAAPRFPGPPTRPRWLLYHPSRPGTGEDRGGTWRGTGRGDGQAGATARSTGRPPPTTTTGWSTDRGEATATTTKSPPTQNLRFVPHPRRARKVAFYAHPPYKKFPVGMTNLDTNIFSRKSIRFEVGGYVRRGL